MKNNFRYSIIYAVIRPEISEQLSVGLCIVDGDKVDVVYSPKKIHALQSLFSEKQYQYFTKVMESMKTGNKVTTVEDINYLTRYSNNLIAFSPLQTIEVAPTEQSKQQLFNNYVGA